MDVLRRERLTLAAAIDDGGTPVGDGRAAWVRLPFTRALLERARRARASRWPGPARSRQDEPFVLAVTWTRTGRALVVGRSIDRTLLAEVERADRRARAPRDRRRGEGATPPGHAGLRVAARARRRLAVARAGDRRLRRAAGTRRVSSLLLVGGAGVLIVAGLMLVLSRLLRRSVVRPVLRACAPRCSGSRAATTRPAWTPSGAGEIRTLVGGFNDMATLVEAQRDRLQALAESDPLTGLANHRRFHQALADTIGSSRSAAVVVLDLDHFKFLNDTRGHPYGDQVLREVAAKLREAVRGAPRPRRPPGRRGVRDPAGRRRRRRGVPRRRARPGADPRAARSTASRSTARRASPRGRPTPTRRTGLLDLADAALYQAKRLGRGQTRRVDADSGEAAVDQQRAAVRRLLDRPDADHAGVPADRGRSPRAAWPATRASSRFPAEDGRRPDEWFDLARRCGLGPLLQALALRRMVEVPGRPNRTWLSLNLDAGALATDAVQGALPEDLDGIVIEVTEQELPPDDEALQRTSPTCARGARRSRSTTRARATPACSTWCASGRTSSSSTAASCAGSTATPSGSR